MNNAVPRADSVEDDRDIVGEAYLAWKRAKVERGLAQSRDRTAMIPIEQVLRDLTLER